MPTTRRRIALTADPELESALAAARRQLGDLPEARLVRELALRGAHELGAPDATARAIAELERAGVRWPAESMASVLEDADPLGSPDPGDPYRGTRALEDLRADNV